MVYSLLKFYIKENDYYNVVLGTFDGVHLGHQKVIKQALENKKKTLIISLSIFNNNSIFPIEENLSLLQNIDPNLDVLWIPLEAINKKITKEEFISFLQKINIKEVFVGKDYKFGYKRLGDNELLKQYFKVSIVDFYQYNNIKVSSTLIREKLLTGEIEVANALLEKVYFIKGKVIKNKQLGRIINFPTINIVPKNNLLKNGVYKSKIKVRNQLYDSVTNVGVAPTIDQDKKLMIETHIIEDFGEEIYGEDVKVFFYQYLREEKKFKDINSLKEQLKKDVKLVKGEK